MRAPARFHTLAILVVVVSLLAPAPARAWGFAAHRFIVEQAIARLPAALRPFYEKNKTFLLEYCVLPDLLRNLDVPGEPPRHFLDFDAYGAYPFDELPRDFDAAVKKFGRETVEKNGTLPWRADEIYGRLVKAFDRAGRREAYSIDDARLMSAVLAHYVADAYVPFHAVVNYDGQLTGQRGIHSRFESELFERRLPALQVANEAFPPVTDLRPFIFDALLKSATLAGPILDADRRAVVGLTEYGDEYFDRWSKTAGPILDAQVSDAIAATVAVFEGAWERAGRPELPLELPHRVRKIGR
jgi:hypothetical protein